MRGQIIPITDEDVKRYSEELKKIIEEEGFGGPEDVPLDEQLDPSAQNIAIMINKKKKK